MNTTEAAKNELIDVFKRIDQAKQQKKTAKSTSLKNEITSDINSMREQVFMLKSILGLQGKSDKQVIKSFSK